MIYILISIIPKTTFYLFICYLLQGEYLLFNKFLLMATKVWHLKQTSIVKTSDSFYLLYGNEDIW